MAATNRNQVEARAQGHENAAATQASKTLHNRNRRHGDKECRRQVKGTTVKDEFISPQINLEQEQSKGALATKQQIEAYLQRKAEVTQDDHQAFQDYLSQKEQTTSAPEDEPQQPSKFNRRNLLKVVAGTAVVGEAAAATYSWVTGGSASDPGAKLAGSRYAEAQRQNIERT